MPSTLATIATPSSEVLVHNLDGEAVLLDLASENYFGLNPVGTRIWELLDAGLRLQNVFDVLAQEYDVDPKQLQTDLLALVDELAQAGLVHLDPG